MKKKLFALLLAGTMLVTALSGCTAPASSAGKTVVIGVQTDLKTLDPGYAYEVYANMVTYATYDMLFRVNGTDMANPVPSVTTDKWTIDETRTTYTFPIQSDILFASGNKLSAKDVVWSFKRVMNLKSNTYVHAKDIESVSAPNDNTVVVKLKGPDASFIAKLASNAFCILDSKLLTEQGVSETQDMSSDKGKAYLDKHSAGSGAFVIESWVQGTELLLSRNPKYRGEKTNVEKIIIKEIPDTNTQIQMLEKGDIDMAMNIGPDNVPTLKDKANISLSNVQTSTCTFLVMNRDTAVGKEMANPDVQEAVRLAIDYNGIRDIGGTGSTTPLNIIPQGFSGAKSQPDNYRNVAKAKELMKKAGYEKGFSTDLMVANFETEGVKWSVLAQKIQSDLKEIGITVNIKTSEFNPAYDTYRQGKAAFAVMLWSPDYYDINNQLVFLPGEEVGGGRNNWKVTPDNQKLTDLAKKIRVESDSAKRAAYSEEMQELMATNNPYAFLLQHPKTFAYTNTLENIVYNDLSKVQLAELKMKP